MSILNEDHYTSASKAVHAHAAKTAHDHAVRIAAANTAREQAGIPEPSETEPMANGMPLSAVTAVAAQSAPNAGLLEAANKLAAERDANGQLRSVNDQAHREAVNAAFVKAFETPANYRPPAYTPPSANDPDRVKVGNVWYKRGTEPGAQPVTTAQPANAADALVQRIERGEAIARDEVSPSVWGELTSGYKIDLPSTHALDSTHIDMLMTARDANVPQSVIDNYIREALKND